METQVNAFMLAKFQSNRPSNYGVIVIVRKLTPPSFLPVARALRVTHIYRNSKILGERDELAYKKDRE